MKRLLIATIATFSLSMSATAQGLTLRFDPYPPTKGTSVRFVPDSSGRVSAEALSGLPLRREHTRDEKYVLAVDTASFQRDKFHRFSFDAYVQSASEKPNRDFQKFRVIEDPVGTFPDGEADVTFHVGGSSGAGVGTIKLPIHSDDGSENVSLAIPSTPQNVNFSGPSTRELGLTNTLDLPVKVATTQVSSILCEPCWESMSTRLQLSDLRPHKGTSLIVSLRPNTLKAIGQSVMALNPSSAHDTIKISVTSVAEQGGLVTTQEFRFPVRFAPPALYLFVIVIGGSVLGAVMHLWLAPTVPGKRREVAVAFGIGIFVWVIALIVFSLETRVTVFGLSLDPTQLIPAAVIAFLASGGGPVVSRVKEALGR